MEQIKQRQKRRVTTLVFLAGSLSPAKPIAPQKTKAQYWRNKDDEVHRDDAILAPLDSLYRIVASAAVGLAKQKQCMVTQVQINDFVTMAKTLKTLKLRL